MKNSVLVISLLLLVSCASKNQEKKDAVSVEQNTPAQEVEAKEEMADEGELEVVDLDEGEVDMDAELGAAAVQEKEGKYIIENGDTYMWIAYKLYGDFRRWREIMQKNPNSQITNLKVGETLSYEMPEKEYNWVEPGVAYRIQKGDSLSKISMKFYGTRFFWKKIWENNKRMISNPNLIYANFILFYKNKSALALK